MREHSFHDLDRVIDEVHSLFVGWINSGIYAGTMDEFGLEVMKLAVHEWMANLVQHAVFSATGTEIKLWIEKVDRGLRCTVEDNSDGFDFHAQIDTQTEVMEAPEPSERGRGLLMMIACTEDLTYETAENGKQRLEFTVCPPVNSSEMPPLFPGVDEQDDLQKADGGHHA